MNTTYRDSHQYQKDTWYKAGAKYLDFKHEALFSSAYKNRGGHAIKTSKSSLFELRIASLTSSLHLSLTHIKTTSLCFHNGKSTLLRQKWTQERSLDSWRRHQSHQLHSNPWCRQLASPPQECWYTNILHFIIDLFFSSLYLIIISDSSIGWYVCIGLQRCGKSCRLRWTNYLRPDIKRGRFSFEEEETIIQLHSMLGNKYVTFSIHLG